MRERFIIICKCTNKIMVKVVTAVDNFKRSSLGPEGGGGREEEEVETDPDGVA